MIATFTGVSPGIPLELSSRLRQYPISRFTSLDVEKLMMALTELNFTARHDPADFTFQEKGLWRKMKFRLSLEVRYNANENVGLKGLQSQLLNHTSPQDITFLNDFYDAFTKAPDTEEAPIIC